MGILEYSRYNVGTIMNLVLAVPKLMICLYHTNLSHEVPLSFVLWSFQVLGEVSMDYGIRSGKRLSLGMPEAPQDNIQGLPSY